ncbi:hypothetical protein KBK24_0112350 [Burkholderia sp. K24]|nr:hypothetical protein KBK24_0112350 [Burkholderia sp. K24]
MRDVCVDRKDGAWAAHRIAGPNTGRRRFAAIQPDALRLLFLFALRWLVAPFAGIGIVARVVAFALFGARFVGPAEFGAPVAHSAWRIGLTQRRW